MVTETANDYRDAHPTTAELVIEVAVTSADIDREKAELYSAAGVKEYWLILANEHVVEVYRGPSSKSYTAKQALSRTDVVSTQCISTPRTLELTRLFG